MNDERVTWSEEASGTYQRIAAIAVPQRAEQIATMLSLLPFSVDDTFQAVELGSGEGRLAAAVLEAFPNATMIALDGSESMRSATAARLQRFEGRYQIAAFDLLRNGWLDRLDGAGAVLSSLVVHHLDGEGKQQLFQAVRERIATPGALLIADLVLPQNTRVYETFGGAYDDAAWNQSMVVAGSDAYYQDFLAEEWNFFRYPDEDDWDKPSPLFHQLQWLADAGFEAVDCFWLQAGHAIYGGYTGTPSEGAGLTYSQALEIARRAVEA